jgi:hypothetical protein
VNAPSVWFLSGATPAALNMASMVFSRGKSGVLKQRYPLKTARLIFVTLGESDHRVRRAAKS